MTPTCSDLLRIATTVLASAYLGIALLHMIWALGGTFGLAAALPSVEGRFVFRPGRVAILSVAVLLASCSALLYSWTGLLTLPISRTALRAATGLLGVGMLMRAVGDFRYVGLFRAIGQSQFARMDRWLYTPFCTAAGVLLLASALACG